MFYSVSSMFVNSLGETCSLQVSMCCNYCVFHRHFLGAGEAFITSDARVTCEHAQVLNFNLSNCPKF